MPRENSSALPDDPAPGTDNGGAPIRVERPQTWAAPLIFASPHSGCDYPADFQAASRLSPLSLRRSEDAFIDEIYARAPEKGAPLLRALFPRAYVDPNREAFELDPDMFTGPLPDYVITDSPRVRAGLGTIARVVTNGEDIYTSRLDFDEIKKRIERCYVPYHEALEKMIGEAKATFGAALLVDCHSMPSVGGPMDRDPGLRRVDMVLGDCHGTACAPAVTDLVESTLKDMGFVVTRNAPYAGGYTTRHYGRPEDKVHAIQIEINRVLYMDEIALARSEGIHSLSAKITRLIETLSGLDRSILG